MRNNHKVKLYFWDVKKTTNYFSDFFPTNQVTIQVSQDYGIYCNSAYSGTNYSFTF